MKKASNVLSAVLSGVMALSMCACGGSDTGSNTPESSEAQSQVQADSTPKSYAPREMKIGTWWVQYYDSTQAIEDSPDYTTANNSIASDNEDTKAEGEYNLMVCQKKFDNVKTIEDKYNCTFKWDNLTYDGVKESINTSILAGTPDCDIYLVETGMGVPAQANGLALDLKTVLPADSDIFTTQKVMKYLDLGDGKACIFYPTSASAQVEATYPLAYNVQMLEENNLEDPCELYDKGEWTWDKFNEYCQVLTQDTDGDGQNDQYGYCGYNRETLECLMMSNGANIANGTKEGITSTAMAETLKEVSDLFNVYNVCFPYDYEGTPSDSMRNQYTQGNIGFFPCACWIQANHPDYDFTGEQANLPFDVKYVRWPVGPSGNKDTNAGKNLTSGTFYMLPAGVQEPERVYNMFYDLMNWYGGDESMRDDKKTLNWWYTSTAKDPDLQVHNFDVMNDCGAHSTFDLWEALGFTYDIDSLTKGEVTPAQFQETYKQQVQDGLDAYFAK